MRLTVNGEKVKYEGNASLKALLEARSVPPERVALTLNGEVMPRAEWADSRLTEGDCIEILTMAGGG